MDAVEFMRIFHRMCKEIRCTECIFFDEYSACDGVDDVDPVDAVTFVQGWAMAHPVEPGIVLTAMERRFAQIYIEKGYLWAARDKDGELNLYKREPKRGGDVFVNTSPLVNGSRKVTGLTFSGITWESSPVCFPKLLEQEG